MDIRIRADSVEIGGYVNAVERDSKPLQSRLGRFVEKICAGAFRRALARNGDVRLLLNHDWRRDLGSTATGELTLTEDNIGLRAEAVVRDREVVEKARAGRLVGWSFGFRDVDVEEANAGGMPHRSVRDLDLLEVSILDDSHTPAYDGTLLTARSRDEAPYLVAQPMPDKPVLREAAPVDYTEFETILKEMKGEN